MTVVRKNICGFCGVDLKCELTSSERIDELEEIRYTTYGISIINSNGETVFERGDISSDRSFVKEFIALCQIHHVSGFHIEDVLEDYLP